MTAYREETSVRASWVLGDDEVDAAYRVEYDAWTHATRLALGAAAAAEGLVYVLTLSPGVAALGFALIVAVNVLLARLTTRRASIAQQYGAMWEDRRHEEVEVTEESLRFANRSHEETVDWELVVHWREDETAFHVYPSPAQDRVIPKRALANAEQQTALRRLLADRVKPGGEAEVRAARARNAVPTVVYALALSLLAGAMLEALLRVL